MKNIGRSEFLKIFGISCLSLLSPTLSSSNLILPTESSIIRVAHLTDIHVEDTYLAKHGFASCLHAVNSLPQRPDFIINGGDAIMNAALTFSKEKVKEQWGVFKNIISSENSIPIYHCIGNHDLYGWPMSLSLESESRKIAMSEYGLKKPYYSFTRERWKFIVLDSIRAKKSIPGYYAELDDEQMTWLADELENTPRNIFICIISHVPILAICTLFDGLMAKDTLTVPDSVMHADSKELASIFYRYPNVRTCLSGHIHMIDHVNYLGVDYYCNGAVSGAWWHGNHHQHPPSFSVMNFHEDGKVTREIQYYNWK